MLVPVVPGTAASDVGLITETVNEAVKLDMTTRRLKKAALAGVILKCSPVTENVTDLVTSDASKHYELF